MTINVSRVMLAVSTAAMLVLTGGATVNPADEATALAAGSPVPTPGPGDVAQSTPTTASATTAPATSATSAVGALFSGGNHFCSASVVHSPSGDLVLTAAHCLSGGTSGLTFVPGYHDGVSPYGSWTVTAEAVPAGWTASADQDLDFAFLTVTQSGNPASLESLTGANRLGISQGFVNQVTLTGYPDTTSEPVVCTNTTSQSDVYQERIACPGFPDGTSGGPWVTATDPETGLGTVVGVIGGYEQGGDTPDVSYSAYFDDDIQQLYSAATS